MTSLGILQRSLQHEGDYLSKLGAAGSTSGFNIYRFSPNQHFRNSLHGMKYDPKTKKWMETNFPVPDFIYDRCFHNGLITEMEASFIRWLKNESNATFLGHGLPGKWAIYKQLKQKPFINRHLPQTVKLQPATSASVISDLLTKHEKVVLKPVVGSQGNGLMLLTRNQNQVDVQINHNGNVLHHTYDTTSSFLKMMRRIQNQRDYIAQEWLSLLDQNNRPFDRRVVMKKTSIESWKEIGRATRLGSSDSFVSNLHSGGTIQSDHKLSIPEEVLQAADQKINLLSRCIATNLESTFPPLFELGLDFGIDQSGKVWLLEANSKPGHKAIQPYDSLHFIPFQYCRSLMNEKKGVIES